jgi:hypothetical protein
MIVSMPSPWWQLSDQQWLLLSQLLAGHPGASDQFHRGNVQGAFTRLQQASCVRLRAKTLDGKPVTTTLENLKAEVLSSVRPDYRLPYDEM